jgi:Holliday junction resolvasome RuvABC endonuclease subunit
VVGIDPGARNTGLAAVHVSGGKFTLADAETVKVENGQTFEMAKRVLQFAINQREPGVRLEVVLLVFEVTPRRGPGGRPVFFKSSFMTQRTIGAVDAVLGMRGFRVAHYDEEEMRAFCTGRTNASKEQVRGYVKRRLKTGSEKLDQHQYDACAAAFTHMGSIRLAKFMKA